MSSQRASVAPTRAQPFTAQRPGTASKAISTEMLRLHLHTCKASDVRAFLKAHGVGSTGKREQLRVRVMQLHADNGGALAHLHLLEPAADQVLGRPIVAFRHFNFGKGEVLRLPVPSTGGRQACGSYSTGAIGVAPADVLPAAGRFSANQMLLMDVQCFVPCMGASKACRGPSRPCWAQVLFSQLVQQAPVMICRPSCQQIALQV